MILAAMAAGMPAAAWNITPGAASTAIDFADISVGHPSPYTIEKAAGKWSAYSKIGQSTDGSFTDNNGDAGAYYRIVDAAGAVLDTISLDRQLFGDKILIFSPSDNMDSVAANLHEIDRRLFGHEMDPDREVKVMAAQGLRECRKMLQLAKTGKLDGYLLEGMACPGGCVAGAGTLQNPGRATAALTKYKASAPEKSSTESRFASAVQYLHE